jgi:hypothetical protein
MSNTSAAQAIGGLSAAAAQALATESPASHHDRLAKFENGVAGTAGIPETRLGAFRMTSAANVIAENQQAMPSLTTYLVELF